MDPALAIDTVGRPILLHDEPRPATSRAPKIVRVLHIRDDLRGNRLYTGEHLCAHTVFSPDPPDHLPHEAVDKREEDVHEDKRDDEVRWRQRDDESRQ